MTEACEKLCGEERQLLLRRHDRDPIVDHLPEAAGQAFALGGFAMERSDLFGILPRAHQIETEVGLELLLLEVQRNEPPADQMGQDGADDGIDQRRPDQITRNGKRGAEQVQRRLFRQRPTE